MLFASKNQLKSILKCKILIADSTFELAPLKFQQIFSIHGFVIMTVKFNLININIFSMKKRMMVNLFFWDSR